jgi:hypothetical protein
MRIINSTYQAYVYLLDEIGMEDCQKVLQALWLHIEHLRHLHCCPDGQLLQLDLINGIRELD